MSTYPLNDSQIITFYKNKFNNVIFIKELTN